MRLEVNSKSFGVTPRRRMRMYRMWTRGQGSDSDDADALLRQGLRSLAVPEASSDFDSRVHQALAKPEPLWAVEWRRIRPVFASAVLSMAISVAILAVQQTAVPIRIHFHKASPTSTFAASTEAVDS